MRTKSVVAALMVFVLLISGASMAFAAKGPKAPKMSVAQGEYNKVVNTPGSLVKNLASLAGTSTAAVNAMRETASLAAVATSLGVDPQAVVDKTQTGLKARLAKLVKKHEAKASLAAKLLAKSTARLWKLMNRVPEIEVPVSVPTSPTPSVPTSPAV